ncbi:hypothetical protein Bca101_092432 [Brassica carinata]
MQSPVTNEDAIVAVAAVEDTVPGGDSQPAVAVDSSDLGTVSPAPVPFVPTLGAWAKPLKLSPSALSVQRKFGSNLLQDLSYPTSHWPSLPSGQREGHTKNMATPVPNKGPMVTVAGGDSQPVVAVDSPDLRSTVFSPVSPAPVPLALESKADVTVSKDGSGKFTTVKEAVASAPENSKTRYTILVKRGTYLENVIIGKNKTNLTILGEGSNLTTITGSWNHVDGKGTYDSATLAVDGEGFMAQDICIENTAGPTKEQAVALRVSADKASAIDDLIDPAGWAPWDNDERRLSTLFYGEYQNSGPGAGTVKRVTWKGFKVITDPKEAEQFTRYERVAKELRTITPRPPVMDDGIGVGVVRE